jgi:AGCS family alanine or glycine:cation symporter
MSAAQQDAAATAPGFIDHVTNVSDFIWGGTWNGEQAIPLPPMVLILLGIGLYIMIGLRFYPLRKIFPAFAGLFRKGGDKGSGEISSFAALSDCALGPGRHRQPRWRRHGHRAGRPGRDLLDVDHRADRHGARFRGRRARHPLSRADAGGTLSRRPDGLYPVRPWPEVEWLGHLLRDRTLISAIVTGNMIQANSVGDSFETLTGWDDSIGGLITAIAVFIVIIGGIKSIGAVAERVVPTMALAYIVLALIAIIINIEDIPETFGLIFYGAFNPQAATGGFAGAAVIIALRAGVARGLFSNEAGQGSTPIAHAVARTNDPAEQGRFAMMGTFIDTIIVCTMTALVILTVQGSFPGTDANGVATVQEHAWNSDLRGFEMTAGAFSAAFPATFFGLPLGA